MLFIQYLSFNVFLLYSLFVVLLIPRLNLSVFVFDSVFEVLSSIPHLSLSVLGCDSVFLVLLIPHLSLTVLPTNTVMESQGIPIYTVFSWQRSDD